MSDRKAARKGRPARPAWSARGARQTKPERPSDDPETLRQEAEAQVQGHADALRAHALPVEAEPAFVFRP